MSGSLSASDRQRIGLLETFGGRVQHVHGLVERFAVESDDPDRAAQLIRRAFGQLKMEMMGAGFDAMAQLCGGMEMAARRGGSRVSKLRVLRDGVGSLRQQLELEQRSVRSQAADRERRDPGDGGDSTPPPPGES